MTVFDFKDYRGFLHALIETNQNKWGSKGAFAKRAGCHSSYFSQVLKGRANLTLDHAIGISNYMEFDIDETAYFLDLVQLEKAGSQELIDFFEKRLEASRKKQADFTKHISAEEITNGEDSTLYYSSWYWSAIHIMTGLKKKKSEQEIAQNLALPPALVRSTLLKLKDMGLVEKSGGHWSITKLNIHLPKQSVLSILNHTNWRHRAILDIQNFQSEDSFHYTSVQSISSNDIPRIRQLILNTVAQSREVVQSSGEEELVCLNCDFFRV